MLFDQEFETLPREALEALQLKRLVAMRRGCTPRSPFTRRHSTKPESNLRTSNPERLRRLPFTNKIDLRTTILSAFSPCHEQVCGSTPLPGPPENHVVGYTRGTSIPGRS